MVKSKFKITIGNSKKVINNMTEKERKIEKSIAKVLDEVGLFMQGEVKQSVAGRRDEPTSVDTGLFLNRILEQRNGNEVTIFTPLKYPVFLEKGTRTIHPRYHFKNSLTRNKNKIELFFLKEIKKII